jgi:hypothetical protein
MKRFNKAMRVGLAIFALVDICQSAYFQHQGDYAKAAFHEASAVVCLLLSTRRQKRA